LKQNIFYLILGRFFIGIGILIIVLTLNLLYPDYPLDFEFLYIISAFIIFLSLLYFLLHGKSKISSEFLLNFQLIIDIILISCLIYVTGVSNSPFIFLLTFPIIISSLFLNKRSTIIMGILSFLFLTLIIVFFSLVILEVSLYYYINRIILYGFSFTGITILSIYLAERLKAYSEEIQRKRQEFQSLNILLQTIIENIEYAFITIDSNKKIIFKNKKAKELFKDYLPDFIGLISVDKVEEKYRKEIEYRNRIYGVSVEKIQYYEEYYYILLIDDLTEEKKKEKKKEMQEKLAYLGEIAAGMAHEIRNPLASLMGSVQLFKEPKGEEDENRAKLRKIIIQDIKRLSSIIEDFLIFTENRKIKVRKFNVKQKVQESIENISDENFIKDKIQFNYFIKNRYFFGNPYHFSLIFKNLLTNSIKAVKNIKGKIKIAIFVDDSKMILRVNDKGVGIEKNKVEKIFNPFYSQFNNGGMGMGLAIVRRIVDLYNGEIKIRTLKGKGTSYSVVLPQQRG